VNANHEHHSRQLTLSDFESAMEALPALIEQHVGNELFTVMYGFDCNIHNDLTYVPMRVMPRHLPDFFRDSIAQRIFRPGHTDLHIEIPTDRMTITFCHESDLHFGGNDSELIERFLSASPFCGFDYPERQANTR
jgi:hypothetical protein